MSDHKVSSCRLSAAIALLSFSALAAIPPEELTVPKAYTNEAGKVLLYRWAEPTKVEPGKTYPLVVLFHGAGERGNDNVAQLKHGAKDLLNYMKEKGIEAYFIAGQCPNGQQWVNVPWGNLAHRCDGFGLVIVSVLVRSGAADFSRISGNRKFGNLI